VSERVRIYNMSTREWKYERQVKYEYETTTTQHIYSHLCSSHRSVLHVHVVHEIVAISRTFFNFFFLRFHNHVSLADSTFTYTSPLYLATHSLIFTRSLKLFHTYQTARTSTGRRLGIFLHEFRVCFVQNRRCEKRCAYASIICSTAVRACGRSFQKWHLETSLRIDNVGLELCFENVERRDPEKKLLDAS
jgi:hypothetical protein